MEKGDGFTKRIKEVLKDIEHYEFPDDIINCSLACEAYRKKKIDQATQKILEIIKEELPSAIASEPAENGYRVMYSWNRYRQEVLDKLK